MCKYEELVQELFKNATLLELYDGYRLSFGKSTLELVTKMQKLFPEEYEKKVQELINKKESK